MNEFANIIFVLDIFDYSITFRIYGCRNDDEELQNLMENLFVFTFPRFYSIFFVDFSQIFDPFHTYLKHGTVNGSNICEWIKYL